MALKNKPEVGSFVWDETQGKCVVKVVNDDSPILGLESEDGKHAFNQHADNLKSWDDHIAEKRSSRKAVGS